MNEVVAHSRSAARVLATFIFALTAASLTACGGGGEEAPPDRLVLEADLSDLPPEADLDEAMTALVGVLERRAASFGYPDLDILREGDDRVTMTPPEDIPTEEFRQLMEATALLELRQPVLDDNDDIVCESPDAGRFSVSREEITYEPEAPGDLPAPRCAGGDGQKGEIVWEPAVGLSGQDQTPDAPPVTIQVLRAIVDRTEAPVLILSLNPVDAQLIETTSAQLVGLPLGIFLDGEMLAGPTIQEPITTGSLPIAGLSLSRANILAAQLEAGSLPVPIKESSMETASE